MVEDALTAEATFDFSAISSSSLNNNGGESSCRPNNARADNDAGTGIFGEEGSATVSAAPFASAAAAKFASTTTYGSLAALSEMYSSKHTADYTSSSFSRGAGGGSGGLEGLSLPYAALGQGAGWGALVAGAKEWVRKAGLVSVRNANGYGDEEDGGGIGDSEFALPLTLSELKAAQEEVCCNQISLSLFFVWLCLCQLCLMLWS